MAVRLLFLLFVIILVGFAYISLLNGQHIPFFYSAKGQMDITVAELVILSFSLGAAMVILGTLVKDVTMASRNWKERREKQRKEAARARVAKAQELSQKGMLDEAAKELERSLSVNPDDREALDLLSHVESERGNPAGVGGTAGHSHPPQRNGARLRDAEEDHEEQGEVRDR